ncbi:syntaxin [Acrasis kona]|uniref:Syntaxin n=1 Tax=Acrasis kona TaxID=1008807 RepID=A0AAW2ZN17_9EUKA
MIKIFTRIPKLFNSPSSPIIEIGRPGSCKEEYCEYDTDATVPPGAQTCDVELTSELDDFTLLYNTVGNLGERLQRIDDNSEKMREYLVGCKTAGEAKQITSQCRDLIACAKSEYNQIITSLKQLEQKNKQILETEGETSIFRLYTIQTTRLRDEFSESLKKYENVVQEWHTKQRSNHISEISVQFDVDFDLLSTMEIGNAEMHTLQVEKATALEYFKALRNLDKCYNEMHEMFVEFHSIVWEQDPLLDIVEQNVTRAVKMVNEGSENIEALYKKLKRARIS